MPKKITHRVTVETEYVTIFDYEDHEVPGKIAFRCLDADDQVYVVGLCSPDSKVWKEIHDYFQVSLGTTTFQIREDGDWVDKI